MKLDGSDYAVHRGNSKTRTIVYYISGINDGYIKIVIRADIMAFMSAHYVMNRWEILYG